MPYAPFLKFTNPLNFFFVLPSGPKDPEGQS